MSTFIRWWAKLHEQIQYQIWLWLHCYAINTLNSNRFNFWRHMSFAIASIHSSYSTHKISLKSNIKCHLQRTELNWTSNRNSFNRKWSFKMKFCNPVTWTRTRYYISMVFFPTLKLKTITDVENDANIDFENSNMRKFSISSWIQYSERWEMQQIIAHADFHYLNWYCAFKI